MAEFPPWLFPLFATVAGLVVGSFLNVVVHRLPRGMSLLRPRSHCPNCLIPVVWYDNVPILSYVFLAGRCRHCRAPISWRYPLLEALSGLWFCASAVLSHNLSVFFHAVIFGCLCLALAFIDLEHLILPDVLTLPGLGLGLLWTVLGGPIRVRDALWGLGLGVAIPLAIFWVYRLLRGVEGMGLGDVKLLGMFGAFLGWRGMLLSLGLGAVMGALVGVGLVLGKKASQRSELPFGTFLCAAALVVRWWGAELWQALFSVPP
ncbi:MAG: prepilin peptidase [Thermoanaerobaculum sp.]|nr:prepilin peptidase [Thermoanaerobaculum sp.]MDW7966716.1 A24 family peptidase [Thermoanaerobaculum sp.]